MIEQGQTLRSIAPLAFLPALWLSLAACRPSAAAEWPQFRGPNEDGTSPAADVPTTWSEQHNVRWKTALNGEGWSSPVIAGGRIWVTLSREDGHSLRAVCLDAESGRVVKDVEVFRLKPLEPIDNTANTYASPTPVLDRGRLFVSYGMHGNAALDASSGKVLWRNQDLRYSHDRNGPGSSPMVQSNLVIIPCDGPHNPFIAALDAGTGKIAWVTRRSKSAGKAFSTPVVASIENRSCALSVFSRRCGAYDLLNGREIWAVDLPGNTIVPTPVVRAGVVYLCTGFPHAELWAVRLSGAGVVPETKAVLWKCGKQVPQTSSPILARDNVYFVSDSGIVTCLDAQTGQEHFSERLSGTFHASPVCSASNLYWSNVEGATFVLPATNRFLVLATNVLDDGCHASPAVLEGALYLRTTRHLYRIGR
jgi:outer membrane protein assembly factor BamB